MTLAGPCIMFAPLVFVVMALAFPLWPVAIVAVGLLWCLVWPLERLFKALGIGAMSGWSNHVAYWFIITLKPKYFFDPVDVRAARRAKYGIKPREDSPSP
jgi:hypothetical protein